MQVRLKLMGALKEKTPPEDALEVSDGATINDVLSTLGIAAEEVQIVMVNGKPKPDRTASLAADDELTILAPVGGG